MIEQQYRQYHRYQKYTPNWAFMYWRHFVLSLSITCSLFVILKTLPTSPWEKYLDIPFPTTHSIITDPYLHPGTLSTRNGTGSSLIPFWHPLDPSLPRPPHLLQAIKERQPLTWLQNKTLLLIGDSVDRYLNQYFCELTSGDLRLADITDLDSSIQFEHLFAKSSPVVCRLDYYDFEIISFFHYGLQNDSEEFWSFKSGYTEPGLMENRIPLLSSLFKNHDRQPDMIIMGSGISMQSIS
jgi:hypothetical protein